MRRNTPPWTAWTTVAALALLLVATAAGWLWVWAVFFLYWAVYGIFTGQAFVVQVVYRHEHPVLFWIVSGCWLLLAGLMLVADLFPGAVAGWVEW